MPCVLVTHPEVVIDPTVRVEEWGLTEVGAHRAQRLAEGLRGTVGTIVSSAERKATETAAILADVLGVPASVDAALGEMGRSATGYLPPAEFDRTVAAFFAEPERSVRGWERAIDAQRRIVGAVRGQLRSGRDDGIAFVAHGGVGGLLLASLTAAPVSRALDQPGMGSWFTFDAKRWVALSGWQRTP
jgi:broad specificity phosphatase PhoE